ncbi:hypothetical protein ACLB2K_076595 [Fragaria x ananassa]
MSIFKDLTQDDQDSVRLLAVEGCASLGKLLEPQNCVAHILLVELEAQAAAHGLPMVATKNGGPVDIHRALNNGLLVNPHDQQSIANALLKLLLEKNLWVDCRKNGWKNIHLFSWPEHCQTYLTRVAACRMRYPQWQTDTPEDEMAAEESFNDSLRDVQDMSLRLSVDGDKSSLNESLDVTSGDHEVQDQVKRVLSKMKSDSVPKDHEDGNKLPDNVSRFALLTAVPASETVEFLASGKIQVRSGDVNIF